MDLTSWGVRPAFLGALLVVAALTAGYATAGSGYQAPAAIAPVQLTPVRSHVPGGVVLAKLAVTSRLQPASLRTQGSVSPPTAQVRQTPAVQPVVPAVTPTPSPQRSQTPSSGGDQSFDSSG